MLNDLSGENVCVRVCERINKQVVKTRVQVVLFTRRSLKYAHSTQDLIG